MKKKIVIGLLIIAVISALCAVFVACDIKCNCEYCNGIGISNPNLPADERMVHVTFHYTLTTQFMCGASFKIGSIIYKPENPTFENHVFNGGYDGTPELGVSDFDLPIDNPRMEEGYDVNKNYYFVGWYTEPEYRYKWDFSEDRIFRDMTLFAKWIEII